MAVLPEAEAQPGYSRFCMLIATALQALDSLPALRQQVHSRTVTQAQAHMGRDARNGSMHQRVRSALRVFSIVVTWSLESGIITADSMRCRGYGLPGRTSFSLYRFEANVRSATVVGMVGAGGIGMVLWELFRSFNFQQTCAVMAIIVLVVTLFDLLSQRLRKMVL